MVFRNGGPDLSLEEPEHAAAPCVGGRAPQALAALLERPPDSLGLRFPRQPRHRGRKAFDFRVLEVQGRGYTMVYQAWCNGATGASMSVPEVASAGEHHGQAMSLRGLDDFRVAHGPARLNNGRRARGGHGVEAVAKREKRVGCGNRPR